jgi:hypothetical protein
LDPHSFSKLDLDPHSFSKLDLDPHSLKNLDPDPHEVNEDPKHCAGIVRQKRQKKMPTIAFFVYLTRQWSTP